MREIIGATLAKHEGEIGGVRIAVRNGRKFRTVARIYVREAEPKLKDDDPDGALKPAWVDAESELEDAIQEELDELAHEEGADGWRVYFYDPACEQIASRQRSFDPSETDEPDAPKGNGESVALAYMGSALRDGMKECRLMMREGRLTIGVLTNTLASRESVTEKALEGMTNARIGEIKAEAEAFEAVLAAEAAVAETITDDAENTTVQTGALALIENFLSRITGGGGGGVPDLDAMADAFVNDPDLQQRAAEAMQRAAQRKAEREAKAAAAENGADAPAGAK